MLKNLSFRYKMMLMPIFVLISLVIILFIARFMAAKNDLKLTQIETGYFPAIEINRDFENILLAIQRGLQDAVSSEDEEMLVKTDALRDSFLVKLRYATENVTINIDEWKGLKENFQQYYTLARQVSLQMINGDFGDELTGKLQSMSTQYNEIKNTLKTFTKQGKANIIDAFSQTRTNQNTAKRVIFMVILFSVFVLIDLSILLTRLINRPLKKITKIAKMVALGDLEQIINIDQKDEIGELANSFREVQISLQQIAEKAKQVTEGDLSVTVDVKSEKDELAISLNEMTKSLHEKDEYSNTILNSTQAGVVMVDAETHNIEYVNLAAAEMIGLTEEQIKGNICHKFICPAEKGKCPITDLAQSVDNSEKVLLNSDGEKIDILKSVKTIQLNGRNVLMETFTDISERKKSELAIKQVSAEMHQVLSAISPICGIDTDYNIFRVNDSFCSLMGKDEDKILGKKCYDIIKFDLCKSEQCMLKRIQNNEDKVEAEIECNINNGKTTACSVLAVPLKDTDGNLQGIVQSISDITDRVQSEKELKTRSAEIEKQNRIKSGQNELNEKIRGDLNVVTLCRQIITYLAKYLNAQIGTIYLSDEGEKELTLTGSYAFTQRKNLNATIKIGEGLVGQAAFEKEMISLANIPDNYVHINSSLVDAVPKNLVATPLIFNGKLVGVIELGSVREFSEIEIEFLRNVSENIAIALNSASARIKMKDLLKKTQQQSEELQAQQEQLKVANEELQQQTEELKASEDKLKEQQDQLQVTNEELEEKTDYLEKQKLEIEKKNEDLKKAGQEIELKANEVELASKYKSEFLANMSHELRTPLNSLLILARDLADNDKGNLDEKQVEAADIVYNSGNELLNLINDILDLSKVEAGKMSLNIQSVSLKDIAQNINTNFSHQMNKKGLELKINVDNNLPQTIRTDQQRLEQIIKNLFSNSLKFTSKGGITINFYRPDKSVNLSQSRLDHEKAVAISVIDTGIGIAEEKQAAIFQAFQQADGSTSRKFGGTGLGLSISREMAKLLGGEMQLKSKEGEGSTFTVFISQEMANEADDEKVENEPKIPIRKSDQAAPAISKNENILIPQNGNGSPAPSIDDDRENIGENDRIILVIEDDLNFARTLYRFCQKKDFKFIHAGDGETGLTLTNKYKPDAIILDIKLPGMNGWEVLEILKDDSNLRHIPVHIISADEETMDAFTKGAIGYLTKPVTKEQIEGAFSKLEYFYDKDIKDLLVIEDDNNLRKIIADLIGNGDVKVTAVRTGKSALTELKSKQFDCVILDLKLPDISGFELLKRLEANNGAAIPPVIVYTGKELTQEEEHELSKYAKSIIIKGVRSEDRLLDETALFLHQVVEQMPENKRKIISMLHDKDSLFKDKKVLLVDDDMRNIFAVSKVLEDKQMNVVSAPDGKKALEMLDKNSDVELVLMDIMMPVMDGYETMKRIRAQEKYEKLPIIALTAKAMRDDRQKCIAAGANDYIAKPLNVPKLLSLMRVWLYNR